LGSENATPLLECTEKIAAFKNLKVYITVSAAAADRTYT
jgi:hypothetical protein